MALFVENSRKSHVYVNIDISFGLSRSRETPGGAGVPPAKIQRMAGELFTMGASQGTSRAGRPRPQGNRPYLTLFAHTPRVGLICGIGNLAREQVRDRCKRPAGWVGADRRAARVPGQLLELSFPTSWARPPGGRAGRYRGGRRRFPHRGKPASIAWKNRRNRVPLELSNKKYNLLRRIFYRNQGGKTKAMWCIGKFFRRRVRWKRQARCVMFFG